MFQNWLIAALCASVYFIIFQSPSEAFQIFAWNLIALDCFFLVKAGVAASKGIKQGNNVVRHLAIACAGSVGIVTLSIADFTTAYVLSRALTDSVGFLIFFERFMRHRKASKPESEGSDN